MAPCGIAASPVTRACRDLFDYWRALPQLGGRLPLRAQIDPGALRTLLPYLQIMERLDAGTVVMRLAGTALRQLYGMEMTGRDMLDLVPPSHRPTRRWRVATAAAHPCGMVYSREQRYPSGAVDEVETLFLPLAVAGDPPEAPARQFIGLAASKSGRRWIAEEHGTLLAPHDFRFVDIGYGIPATIDPPGEPPEPDGA